MFTHNSTMSCTKSEIKFIPFNNYRNKCRIPLFSVWRSWITNKEHNERTLSHYSKVVWVNCYLFCFRLVNKEPIEVVFFWGGGGERNKTYHSLHWITDRTSWISHNIPVFWKTTSHFVSALLNWLESCSLMRTQGQVSPTENEQPERSTQNWWNSLLSMAQTQRTQKIINSYGAFLKWQPWLLLRTVTAEFALLILFPYMYCEHKHELQCLSNNHKRWLSNQNHRSIALAEISFNCQADRPSRHITQTSCVESHMHN